MAKGKVLCFLQDGKMFYVENGNQKAPNDGSKDPRSTAAILFRIAKNSPEKEQEKLACELIRHLKSNTGVNACAVKNLTLGSGDSISNKGGAKLNDADSRTYRYRMTKVDTNLPDEPVYKAIVLVRKYLQEHEEMAWLDCEKKLSQIEMYVDVKDKEVFGFDLDDVHGTDETIPMDKTGRTIELYSTSPKLLQATAPLGEFIALLRHKLRFVETRLCLEHGLLLGSDGCTRTLNPDFADADSGVHEGGALTSAEQQKLKEWKSGPKAATAPAPTQAAVGPPQGLVILEGDGLRDYKAARVQYDKTVTLVMQMNLDQTAKDPKHVWVKPERPPELIHYTYQ